MPGMNVSRVGSALAALLLLFGGAWLIGHVTRSTPARASGAPSSLPSASVQRVGVAVGALPVTVALPGLAAAHRPASVKTASTSVQTTGSAQSQVSSQPATSQSSASAPVQTYTPPSSAGSSGASHTSTSQPKKAPPPVVGGN